MVYFSPKYAFYGLMDYSKNVFLWYFATYMPIIFLVKKLYFNHLQKKCSLYMCYLIMFRTFAKIKCVF